MEETTREGIAALKRGDTARARDLLRQAVDQNPDDLKAWLWLSGAVQTDDKRIECLRHVLELDPNHEVARLGLAKLTGSEELPQEEESEEEDAAAQEPEEAEAPADEEAAMPAPETTPAVEEETEEPASEPERGPKPEPAAGVIRFKTRPSILPTLVVGLLWAILLAALYVGARAALAPNQQLLAAAFLAFAALVIATQLGARLLELLSTRCAVTSRHLIAQRGIISRTHTKIPLEAIQDTAVHQTPVERPFGVGDVLIETAGDHGTVTLDDLPRCDVYSEAILKAAEEVWDRLPGD